MRMPFERGRYVAEEPFHKVVPRHRRRRLGHVGIWCARTDDPVVRSGCVHGRHACRWSRWSRWSGRSGCPSRRWRSGRSRGSRTGRGAERVRRRNGGRTHSAAVDEARLPLGRASCPRRRVMVAVRTTAPRYVAAGSSCPVADPRHCSSRRRARSALGCERGTCAAPNGMRGDRLRRCPRLRVRPPHRARTRASSGTVVRQASAAYERTRRARHGHVSDSLRTMRPERSPGAFSLPCLAICARVPGCSEGGRGPAEARPQRDMDAQ